MASVTDILTPSRVRGIISRIRTPGTPIADLFGVGIGGWNNTPVKGRTYTYDIFDNSRTVARGKLPGGPSNAIARQVVGNNTVTLGRTQEKIYLDYNTINNIRAIGEHAGIEDTMGVKYIEAQTRYLKMRAELFREFAIGSLFRGGIYYYQTDGETLIPSYTSSGAKFGVDLQIPSGNKLIGGSFASGLQMGTGSDIITATWATASNDIPTMIMNVSKAFQNQVGAPLARIITESTTFLAVLQNTYVRQLAGTSNAPYAEFQRSVETTPDGTPTGVYKAKINAIPGVDWYVYDGGIQVEAADTYTQLVPDSYVLFQTALDGFDWLKGIEGSEVIKDNPIAPAVERTGLYTWIKEMDDPARFECHEIQNFGIELNAPKNVAIARVR